MRKLKMKIGLVVICLVLTSLFPASAFAAAKILPDENVKLNIVYKDEEKVIPNAPFDLYKVADLDENAYMSLTSQFEPYRNKVTSLSALGSLDSDGLSSLASTLRGYVKHDNVTPVASGKTDANGKLSLTVKPGLYLVLGDKIITDDHYSYSVVPFMISLPVQESGDNVWKYIVTIEPKYEREICPPSGSYVNREALKQWDDEGYESIRPKEITVHLLCDGVISDTVVLNAANNWKKTWKMLDSSHEWLVIEDVPNNYSVKIERNGITFTLKNEYSVDVTGVNPPVQKRITGDTPTTASVFTFTMTAKDASCPMPEGSKGSTKQISITGAGSKEFGNIKFTQPGTYVYTISEVNSGVKGYTYDTTVYTLTYTVTEKNGKLDASKTISNGKANNLTKIEFTNPYKTPGKDLPQTGMLWWPVPVLLAAGLAFVMVGVIRKRRNNG